MAAFKPGEEIPLHTKPDWPQARRRWTAFWDCEPTDRPCMDVRTPRSTDLPPPPAPRTLEDKYFDPENVTAHWVYHAESTYFGGEAVPCGGFLMAGYALGCGDGARFAPDTVWHPVTMSSIDDPLGWVPGPDDPWVPKLEVLLNRLLDEAPGRYLVGYPMQVPANDLLYLLRGGEDFLVDMAADIGKCVRRLEETLEGWISLFERLRAVVDARQQAGTVWNWPGLWHPQMAMPCQSDMSCMISAEMFDTYVMREMDILAERYGPRLWYHVDGPDARRHTARLLEAPYMRAIQYVAGAGQPPNGPAYMDLYRQVQAAGRCLDIDVWGEHVEFIIRHLSPEGLVIRTGAGTPEEADELIDNAVRWAGTHVHSDAGL